MVDVVVVELAPVEVESFVVAEALGALVAHKLEWALEDLVLNFPRLRRWLPLDISFLRSCFHHIYP